MHQILCLACLFDSQETQACIAMHVLFFMFPHLTQPLERRKNSAIWLSQPDAASIPVLCHETRDHLFLAQVQCIYLRHFSHTPACNACALSINKGSSAGIQPWGNRSSVLAQWVKSGGECFQLMCVPARVEMLDGIRMLEAAKCSPGMLVNEMFCSRSAGSLICTIGRQARYILSAYITH